MSQSRTTTSLITATAHLDARMLRDIGVDADGSVMCERDPRYRRIARPTGKLGRLVAFINPPVAAMLFRA